MRRHAIRPLLQLVAFFLWFSIFSAAATTFFVDINSTNPSPPYTNWSTAATDIQSAVNQTTSGDLVLVNPGVYATGGETINGSLLTNRVVINDAITVESVSGPANTIIEGYQLPVPVILGDPSPITPTGNNAIRCVCLTTNATLIGFTLTNGATRGLGQNNINDENGGGVWCALTNGVVISNCVVVANSAAYEGGGAFQGTLVDCIVLDNSAEAGGGIARTLLYGSLLISNSATGANIPYTGGGAFDSAVFNSAIAENNAQSYGGGACGGTLVNCTVTANSAQFQGGGTAYTIQTNCIVYYNKIFSDDTYSTNWCVANFNYCCTTPNPGGVGNITNEPALADISHISSSSPCLGSGNPVLAVGTDIDGNPWNNPPSAGCSEIPSGGDYGNLAVNISAAFTNWAPGYPLNFQTANSGPDYMTVWNFGDGTILTNAPYVSHTWSAAGMYPLALTAFNASYPTGVTATTMITIATPTNYYVNWANPNPVPPYLSWSTAATNIQDAVSVAVSGSTVLVTNPTVAVWKGVNDIVTNNIAIYQYGGATEYPGYLYRVAITNPLTVESVNGPALTYIQGGPEGVFLTDGTALNGFTLTNGYPIGIGLYATSTNATVTNCIITHCSQGAVSGTLYNCSLLSNPYGGSSMSTLNNCLISNNVSQNGGGANGGILNTCLIVSNSAGSGGGVYDGSLANCTLIGNHATNGGATYACILTNCTLTGNWATNGGGAAMGTLLSCTLTNNFALNGGGSDSNVLYNCLLANNLATYGGAALGGSLSNCVIFSNTASEYGGGCCSGIVVNCVITNNFSANGGGTYCSAVTNCLLAYNTATADGGGAELGSLDNCLIITNIARNGGGGSAWATLYSCQLFDNVVEPNGASGYGGGAYLGTLTSCILSNNSVPFRTGAYGGGAANAILTNCLIVQNFAPSFGGQGGGGTYDCYLNGCTVVFNLLGIVGSGATNCISYYNSGIANYSGGTFKNCCTIPLPTGTGTIGNITNSPLFVNTNGDFHLQSNSPCINSGNNGYVNVASDLDGNPRVVGGTVDVGAYEYQTPTSVISYAYLQQYGLPTDGSVDYADLDGTAFNVYQDWIAGLNPTNPASVLSVQPLASTNNTAGIIVSWQSVSGIPYLLQRATNLVAQPPFSTIQSNIAGQAGTTSYADTSATNNIPYFYRVGAQ